MAWDQQYYQDPYGQQQAYDYGYDPNLGYDPYYGYDPYSGYDPYYGYEQQEDTESQKLRREQEERERLEALEANRLYLRKVKKRCVKEDFADLDKLQLFLFEVLIERLEVNSESDLGVVNDKDNSSVITARVQFLNSPYLEICERDAIREGSYRVSNAEENYMQTIGQDQGGMYSTYSPLQEPQVPQISTDEEGRSKEEEGMQGEELVITTKWENASGKSCLFSETALLILQDLERFPVNLQVLRCVTSAEGAETCESLGHAQLRLPDDFGLSVIQACKPGVVLPVSTELRQTLDITNVFGVKKGEVEMFVRLSTFGPVIITSFQTSGPDRKYVFKPNPLDSNFKHSEEHEPPPVSELLKPLITEEENALGITVQKEYDIFQKPVLWKNTDSFDCGCKDVEKESISRFSSLGSLRLPKSDLSLCRNIIPPSIYRKLQFQNESCDWHNLVSSEIKNSPGGNCGCLDAKINKRTESEPSSKPPSQLESPRGSLGEDNGSNKKRKSKVSRMEKMIKPLPQELVVEGFGIPKENPNCGCACPYIKEAMKNNKLFLV